MDEDPKEDPEEDPAEDPDEDPYEDPSEDPSEDLDDSLVKVLRKEHMTAEPEIPVSLEAEPEEPEDDRVVWRDIEMHLFPIPTPFSPPPAPWSPFPSADEHDEPPAEAHESDDANTVA